MSKEKSVAERAVRGVLGGWVAGRIEPGPCSVYIDESGDDGAMAKVMVFVSAKAIRTMLKRERSKSRLTKKGAKRG